jgi:hypothetical protein
VLVGYRRQRVQQDGQAFTGLVDAAEEPDAATVPRPAGHPALTGEGAQRNTVGYEDRVAPQMLDQGLPGALADRDPGADLLQRRLQDPVRGGHRPGPFHRGVEGGDDRADRRPAGEQPEAGRRRLVDVQDVELAVPDPAAHPGR